MAIHQVKDFVSVAGEDKKLVAICEVSERAQQLSLLRKIGFQIVEAPTDLTQAEAVV